MARGAACTGGACGFRAMAAASTNHRVRDSRLDTAGSLPLRVHRIPERQRRLGARVGDEAATAG
jgi:hypothetical protein